jgi:hypothetical protein
LATKTLNLLTSSGLNQELLQAKYKMFTFLMNFDRKEYNTDGRLTTGASVNDGENAMAKGSAIPLNAQQMHVLISFLQASVLDSVQHNPAIGLIKAIKSRE